MLEAIADGMERAKRNINKKSPTYHSDSVVYVKTVPSGDVHYASLEQIGGRTLVWNQLQATSTGTTVVTIQGINFYVSDGELFISGTAEEDGTFQIVPSTNGGQNIPANHKLLFTRSGSGSFLWSRAGFGTFSNDPTQDWGFSQHTASFYCAIRIHIKSGTTYNVSNMKFNVFDLTQMFGAGNEPTTVAEFQKRFPAQWYAFNEGSLLSAGVTEVVSKKADTTTIATYPIPAEIQALDGYGWSAGSVYNYIDFEAKKFIQNVASVDLSTLTWGYGPSVGWSATLNVKNPADDDTAFNGLSATLKATDRNTQATAFSGGTDAGMVSVAGGKVYVGTGSISIVPSGTLIYELDEPVETDISAYITDDNLISVESGGTLTFPNSNGDDYRIDVPGSVTFVVGKP